MVLLANNYLTLHISIKSSSCFLIFKYNFSFNFQPFFSWCKLLEKEQKKAPESAFKFLYYSMAYGYTCYILFNGKYSFFQEPKHCWIGM